MELIRRKTLPQGLLGQAIDYTLKRWAALTQFVEDGTLEIDNNLIENAIRPSALGKKNFLFIRASRSWGTQCSDLYFAGQLSAAGNESVRLFERLVHPLARRENHPNQAIHACGVGQG